MSFALPLVLEELWTGVRTQESFLLICRGIFFAPPPIKTWKYKGHTNIVTQCKGELFRRKTSQANQLKLILRVR